MSAAKDKGTRSETATLRHVQTAGFPWAYRLAQQGINDCGDIALLPGMAAILEIKDHASAATGQPGDAQLRGWLMETERERINAGAEAAALIVKKKGTTDAGRWFCYLDLGELVNLSVLSETDYTAWCADAVVCIDLTTYLALLRANGYGSGLEATA